MNLPDSARQLIESGAHAHLVTLNPDGSPQVTMVWAGLDGDDIVMGHLSNQRKLRNMRQDERVALSFEGDSTSAAGLKEYLVVYGTAVIEEGGAPALVGRLAELFLGPDSGFPPADAPPGFITRVRVERITGVGPWTGRVI